MTGENQEDLSNTESGMDAIPMIGPTDAELERYLDSIGFERCRLIREVGNAYRTNHSIQAITTEFGLSKSEAREAVATYILIFTYTNREDEIIPGEEYGLRYFTNPEIDLSDLIDSFPFEAKTEEEVQEKIRLFVGYLSDNRSIQETDLAQEIPETPNEDLPSERVMDLIDDVNTQIHRNLSLPWLQLQETIELFNQQNKELMASVTQSVDQLRSDIIQNISRPLSELVHQIDFDAIQKQVRIREALESGIEGFEPPEQYNPDEVTINRETREVVTAALSNFIDDIQQQSEVDELELYLNRLEYGLERFEEEDHYASTLVFLSSQDGFLDVLASHKDLPPSGNGYYTSGDRKRVFGDEFPILFGIDGNQVASQWDDFRDHRNKIMHGDPDAHFDDNIATVSLTFLVLAIYTVLIELEE